MPLSRFSRHLATIEPVQGASFTVSTGVAGMRLVINFRPPLGSLGAGAKQLGQRHAPHAKRSRRQGLTAGHRTTAKTRSLCHSLLAPSANPSTSLYSLVGRAGLSTFVWEGEGG